MEKAKERFSKVFEGVKDRWGAASRTTRIVILGVAAALILSVIFLIAISSRTNYEVLYPSVTGSQMSEITTALRDNLGVQFTVQGDRVLVPKEDLERARIEMAMLGYPRSAFNYDIWQNNVGMFSTDSQQKEVQRQQLESNIRATLMNITNIMDANVIVNPGADRPYVISPQSDPATATALITIRPGVRLTAEQIEGITWLIMTSVPGLTLENITLGNQDGLRLLPEDATGAETALALENQKYNSQMALQKTYSRDLEIRIEKLLQNVVRDFSVAVTATLDFSDWTEQDTRYTGSNVDADGMQTGIIDELTRQIAANGMAPEGGLVGTTVDADISPGYPTWIGEMEGEFYFEDSLREHRMVNENIKIMNSNGVNVQRVTCAVTIDQGAALTQDELDLWQSLIANSISARVEDVTVISTVFNPTPTTIIGDGGNIVSPVRNLLVFIVISLGVILIVLFMLAIMSSSSKKKRLVKARAAAAAAGAGAGGIPTFADEGFGSFSSSRPQEEEDETLKIQSLLGSGDGETRDMLLKNEIREFAKTNPDIVAQLIRTWIRE